MVVKRLRKRKEECIHEKRRMHEKAVSKAKKRFEECRQLNLDTLAYKVP